PRSRDRAEPAPTAQAHWLAEAVTGVLRSEQPAGPHSADRHPLRACRSLAKRTCYSATAPLRALVEFGTPFSIAPSIASTNVSISCSVDADVRSDVIRR